MTEIPGVCPVCGAVSLAPEGERSALLAVCDVLVLKALEKMGNFIRRAERSRYHAAAGRPQHEIHTIWPASDDIVDKTLKGAWDVVPALLDSHGCCGVTGLQVTDMLDAYVHDLVITGTAHTLTELAYRFTSQLGLPVFDRNPGPAPISHLHPEIPRITQASIPNSIADTEWPTDLAPAPEENPVLDHAVGDAHSVRRAPHFLPGP